MSSATRVRTKGTDRVGPFFLSQVACLITAAKCCMPVGLVENAAARGAQLRAGLEQLRDSGKYPIIDVREPLGCFHIFLLSNDPFSLRGRSH